MTAPSRLDRKNHPGPPKYDPCPVAYPLHDGTRAPCLGVRHHEGDHLYHITLAVPRKEDDAT